MLKKVCALLLLSTGLYSFGYCADQWDKTKPSSSDNISDYPDDCQSNNEALDRLLYLNRTGCEVIPDTASQIKVLAGTIAIPNSTGSVVKWRRNTSITTVTWSDLDTGTEATSTQYYVYAVADTDATTFSFKISASNTAPSGSTYYRLIGYFYNNSYDDIECVGNIGGNVNTKISVYGTDDISTSSTSYVNMDDMELHFYSEGKSVKITFNAPSYIAVNNISYFSLTIDGIKKISSAIGGADGCKVFSCTLVWSGILNRGTHTVKVKWKVSASTLTQYGASYGNRVLIVEE